MNKDLANHRNLPDFMCDKCDLKAPNSSKFWTATHLWYDWPVDDAKVFYMCPQCTKDYDNHKRAFFDRFVPDDKSNNQ